MIPYTDEPGGEIQSYRLEGVEGRRTPSDLRAPIWIWSLKGTVIRNGQGKILGSGIKKPFYAGLMPC